MNIVVDTNIFFSALISPDGSVSEILLNPRSRIQFYSPKFAEFELDKYENRMIRFSGLERDELLELKRIVLGRIELIDHGLIKEESWEEAEVLTTSIDKKDTPFVALTLELKGLLWTGDKKLINGLKPIAS